MANVTKMNAETNFEISTVHPRIGWVSSDSSVPSRFSSASSLMVAAGTNRASSQGRDGFWISKSTVNRGLSDASAVSSAWLKNT